MEVEYKPMEQQPLEENKHDQDAQIALQDIRVNASKDIPLPPKVLDLIKQAKIFLQDNNYDLKKLQSLEQYAQLSKEDLIKLKNFKRNQKRSSRLEKIKVKGHQVPVSNDAPQQLNVVLQAFDAESKKLLLTYSHAERVLCLKQLREQMGLFTFNRFLTNLYERNIRDGIFQALYDMINDEPSIDHKKTLLLQACLFYDLSKVNLQHDLTKGVFSDFKFIEGNLGQCLGFLYLIYENNSAAFSELSLQQVIELEKEIPMLPIQLCHFLKQFLSPYAKPFFPATLMCLTPPIIKDIQEKAGRSLFYDVPNEFLTEHIEILVYSFESNIEQYYAYVFQMQTFYVQYHKRLEYFGFKQVLARMSNVLKVKDQRWIGNLKKVGDLLKNLILNVIIKKSQRVTDEIFEAALQSNDDFIENIVDDRLVVESQTIIPQFFEDVCNHNKENDSFKEFLEDFDFGQLDKSIAKLVHLANIERLTPIQELCIAYTAQVKSSVFSIVGIGHGKTVICNILAAYFATKRQKQVIVLNKQANLSIRNGILFEQTLGQKLQLLVGFDGTKKNEDYHVIFMCDDQLQAYIKKSEKKIEDLILIIDEADQVLFTNTVPKVSEKELKQWKAKLQLFASAASVYAFSGTLSQLEAECIKMAFGTEVITYPKHNSLKQFQNVRIKDRYFSERSDWLKEICSEIEKYYKKVPILILISNRQEKELLKELKQPQYPKFLVYTLSNKDAISINVAIDEVNKCSEVSGYPIYLFDEDLCRGLDVKTSAKIEDNGGLYVIISKVPSSTKQLQQALGRTQRLLSKGQHSIIIWVPNNKTLWQQLIDSDNKIEFNVRELLQMLKQDNLNQQKLQQQADHQKVQWNQQNLNDQQAIQVENNQGSEYKEEILDDNARNVDVKANDADSLIVIDQKKEELKEEEAKLEVTAINDAEQPDNLIHTQIHIEKSALESPEHFVSPYQTRQRTPKEPQKNLNQKRTRTKTKVPGQFDDISPSEFEISKMVSSKRMKFNHDSGVESNSLTRTKATQNQPFQLKTKNQRKSREIAKLPDDKGIINDDKEPSSQIKEKRSV